MCVIDRSFSLYLTNRPILCNCSRVPEEMPFWERYKGEERRGGIRGKEGGSYQHMSYLEQEFIGAKNPQQWEIGRSNLLSRIKTTDYLTFSDLKPFQSLKRDFIIWETQRSEQLINIYRFMAIKVPLFLSCCCWLTQSGSYFYFLNYNRNKFYYVCKLTF